jgi:hypothetical protein
VAGAWDSQGEEWKVKDKPDVNFEVRFSREKEAGYRVTVNSPNGDASCALPSPLTAQEIEAFVAKTGALPSNATAVKDLTKEFGQRLYNQIFRDQVYGRLCASIDRCEAEDKRLRIVLDVTQTPELADWPWEYLYDQSLDRFLSLSANTTVVRYLQTPQIARSLTIKLPLAVLVMISSPRGYPELDVEQEWAKLEADLASLRREGLVELKRISATRDALFDALENGVFHIFHFIGHGGFDKDEGGFLILEDQNGEGDEIGGKGLGMLLHDHRSLCLVVLNSCEGARASLVQPFAGTAQAIVQEGVPAVVAMQFRITDAASLMFASRFYKAIASYYPVDAALAEARKEIFSQENYVEWATPVLYMQSKDGHIFTPHKEPRQDSHADGGPLEGHYREMIYTILQGRLIPFLGPGVNRCRPVDQLLSQGRYPPDDSEIAEHLARSLSPAPIDAKELVRVSQNVATMFNSEYLYKELHSMLAASYDPTPLHNFLATIPARLRDKGYDPPRYQLIVTSNYDNSLENAFEEADEPFDLLCYRPEGVGRGTFYQLFSNGDVRPIKRSKDSNALSWDQRTVILKINGAFDPHDPDRDSYVITEDHYINYGTSDGISKLLPGQLSKRLQESSFLFLGYRLLDWNFRVIFHRLWADKQVPKKSWVIQPERDPVDQRFWNNRKVEPIHIELKDYVEIMKRRLLALSPV